MTGGTSLKLTICFERNERDWQATLPTMSGLVGYGATIAEAAQSLLDSLIVAGIQLSAADSKKGSAS